MCNGMKVLRIVTGLLLGVKECVSFFFLRSRRDRTLPSRSIQHQVGRLFDSIFFKLKWTYYTSMS